MSSTNKESLLSSFQGLTIKLNGKTTTPGQFALLSLEVEDSLMTFIPKIVINATISYDYIKDNPIKYRSTLEFTFPNKNEYGLNSFKALVYDYITQSKINGMMQFQILATMDVPALLEPTTKFNGKQAPAQFIQSVCRNLNLNYIGAPSTQDSVLITCIGDSLKSMINRAVGMMWNDEKSCYAWYVDVWKNLRVINLTDAILSAEKWRLVNKTPGNSNELSFSMGGIDTPAGTNNYYAGHGINDYKYNAQTGSYDTFHVTKVFKDYNTLNIEKEGSQTVRWENLGIDCGNNPAEHYNRCQQNTRNRSLWSTFIKGQITTLKDISVGDCCKMTFSPYNQNLDTKNQYQAKYLISRKSTKITPNTATVTVTLMGQGTML